MDVKLQELQGVRPLVAISLTVFACKVLRSGRIRSSDSGVEDPKYGNTGIKVFGGVDEAGRPSQVVGEPPC